MRVNSVREYAIERARYSGTCECCGEKAPFEVEGKAYYVEHHIIWLERNGSDTIDNVCGICPNCHAKIHTLDIEEDTEKILNRVKEDEKQYIEYLISTAVK